MKLSATPSAKTLHSIFAAHYKIRQIAPSFKIDKMAKKLVGARFSCNAFLLFKYFFPEKALVTKHKHDYV